MSTITEISLPSHVRASSFTVENKRGKYGELHSSEILNFLKPSLPTTFCEFDSKGRGDAVNIDLYGWDAEQAVGIVQIRQAFRVYKNGFMNVRKTYVLCGYNENGESFRHPVSAGIIHGAIRKGHSPAGVVMACQLWMWNVTPKKLEQSVRQGDVLIVPERDRDPATKLAKKYRVETENGAVELGSHIIESDDIILCFDDEDDLKLVYARKPVLKHSKDQHGVTRAPLADNHGWYSVRMGQEAHAWNHAQRMGD